MRTISGADLGIQAWAGIGRPDFKKFSLPEQNGEPIAKPNLSFFTCNWGDPDQHSTAWLDYMQENYRNGHRDRTGEDRCLWTLTPRPDATLYVIDSLDAYVQLAIEYGQASRSIPNRYAPNWRGIAQAGNVDGVFATDAAIKQGSDNLSRVQPQFNGWSVESTLWLRWCLVTPKLVGRIVEDWTLVRS